MMIKAYTVQNEHTFYADTGDDKPIKQHMRRTPACCTYEEEELLTKMLKAGVSQ